MVCVCESERVRERDTCENENVGMMSEKGRMREGPIIKMFIS